MEETNPLEEPPEDLLHEVQDWTALHVNGRKFEGKGTFNIALLLAGGLTVAKPGGITEPSMPRVIAMYKAYEVPARAMQIRWGSSVYVVWGIEYRIDLACYVVLVVRWSPQKPKSLPRYFSDGVGVQF